MGKNGTSREDLQSDKHVLSGGAVAAMEDALRILFGRLKFFSVYFIFILFYLSIPQNY